MQDYTLGDINPAAPDFNQGNGPAAEEAALDGALAEQAAVSPAAEVRHCACSTYVMDSVTNQTNKCELQPADMADTLRLSLFLQVPPSYHIAPNSVLVCCGRVGRPPASQAAPASSQAAHGRPSQRQSPKSHLRSHGR